jgi:hypothetical protein
MQSRIIAAVFLSLMLAGAACAQDPGAPARSNGQGGYPQRGGRGMGMGLGIPGSRGLMGTVTEVAADHFMIKTEDSQTFIVHFSVNTRIMKQPPGSRVPGAMRRSGGQRRQQGQGPAQGQSEDPGGGFGAAGTPPETIKATEIKVGDAIGAMGELDQTAMSIGAVANILLDPQTARDMAEMRANFGKTWIQGKVTAIDGVKVTLLSPVDNAAHSFVADENTMFRKRREPITLADIEVGEMVRVDGAIKDGAFTAANVIVMGLPPSGIPGGQRSPPPQQ